MTDVCRGRFYAVEKTENEHLLSRDDRASV